MVRTNLQWYLGISVPVDCVRSPVDNDTSFCQVHHWIMFVQVSFMFALSSCKHLYDRTGCLVNSIRFPCQREWSHVSSNPLKPCIPSYCRGIIALAGTCFCLYCSHSTLVFTPFPLSIAATGLNSCLTEDVCTPGANTLYVLVRNGT